MMISSDSNKGDTSGVDNSALSRFGWKPTTNKNGQRAKKRRQYCQAQQEPWTNSKMARNLSISGHTDSFSPKEALSGMSGEERMRMTNWELPDSVVEKYAAKGITSLFEWQLECLSKDSVWAGKNLVYSAPTSGGKTLVAEILMLKRIQKLGKKAIMILPFVSLCHEKMYSLQEIYGEEGIRVEGFMGSYSPPGGFQEVDVAICTIEKANSLINKLMEEKSLSLLGTVVVDELHMIGDPRRGYLLELLLTKIRYMTENHHSQQNPNDLNDSMYYTEANGGGDKLNIQIIGMSATLRNLGLLSTWLDAELVTTESRPVHLVETICHNGALYDRSNKLIRFVKSGTLIPAQYKIESDEDNLVYLTLETLLNGHSVLIFCPTKARCEVVGIKIAKEIQDIGNMSNSAADSRGLVEFCRNMREQLSRTDLKEVHTQLGQCLGGCEKDLYDTVSFGVAFHHAGLTLDTRDIIESSFKRSIIRVIVSTSTLSAGVNLPARRVIVASPMAGKGALDVMTYRQMCGRAGRKGIDSEGESILLCNNSTKKAGFKLVKADLPSVKSALLGDGKVLSTSLTRALLEAIASAKATGSSDIVKYAQCSLFSKANQKMDNPIAEGLQFLVTNGFVRKDGDDKQYMTTNLGSACLASCMGPEDGLQVYKELLKARHCFVLETDLHIIYQVTPLYVLEQLYDIPWDVYEKMVCNLDPGDMKVAELVGVENAFLINAFMTGPPDLKHCEHGEKSRIHHRFYAAMALNDLVNEMSILEVANKYYLSKGVIQNLQQAASSFAGMVTTFCEKLEWSNLEVLLRQFQERLEFGVQRELCDLVRISTINGQMARALYKKGIKTVADLYKCDPDTVETILRECQFKSPIWMLGKSGGLSEGEAARKIVEEARLFIEMELGIKSRIEVEIAMKKPESNEGSPSEPPLSSDNEILANVQDDDTQVDDPLDDETQDPFVQYDATLNPKENIRDNHMDSDDDMSPILAEEDEKLSDDVFNSTTTTELSQDVFSDDMDISMITYYDNELVDDKENHTLHKKNHDLPKSRQLNKQEAAAKYVMDHDSHAQDMYAGENDFDFGMEQDPQLSPRLSTRSDLSESLITDLRYFLSAPDLDPLDTFEDNNELNPNLLQDSADEIEEEPCDSGASLNPDLGGFISARDLVNKSLIPVGSTSLGGRDLNVLRISNLSLIPDEWFTISPFIGVGIHLSRSTKQRRHCIALYNGGPTIYEYAWIHAHPHDAQFTSNERKLVNLFGRMGISQHLVLFDAKNKLGRLWGVMGKRVLDAILKNYIFDPNIAQWMLHFDESEKIVIDMKMVARNHLDRNQAKNIFELHWSTPAVEALVGWSVTEKITLGLNQRNLWTPFKDVEMPVIVPLLHMECNGLGVDWAEVNRLHKVLLCKAALLEIKVHLFAGRQVSLACPDDVGKLLFKEMGLARPPGSKGTGKEVLSEMDHEMARVIMEWRKINHAITNIVKPFLQEKASMPQTGRLNPVYSTFTETGRLRMPDSSLQCVPRDFELHLEFSADEVEDMLREVKVKRKGCQLPTLLSQIESARNLYNESQYLKASLISLRSVVIPCCSEFVIVAADYSQIELRILAHLSRDETLLNALKDADVFRAIAAKWKNIQIAEVTSSMRQEAKRIVYGIIYGIGPKNLAKDLEVDEIRAKRFIQEFMATFPGIKTFMEQTLNSCRKTGYIKTISGRRRYLPNITSRDESDKAEAERLARNSPIQGSACDLMKTAMCKVQEGLSTLFPKNEAPVNWKKYVSHGKASPPASLVYFPILNMHDELIFEVRRSKLHQIAKAIQHEMETCMEFSVKIPVVVKVGDSWGNLNVWDE